MDSTGTLNLLGRVALTIAVGCGAIGSRLFVSATVQAVEQIDRTDNALADLSHDFAGGHASIRALVTMPGSSVDVALVTFEDVVHRNLARLRNLNALVEPQADAYVWTQPQLGNVDVQHIEGEWRAYVTAAAIIPTVPARDLAMRLRMLDLYARKLFLTVATVRDGVAAARARALVAVEGVVALSSGLGGLLIAYLIWHPVFGDVRLRAAATPLVRLMGGHSPMTPANRDRGGWLHSASSSRLP